VAHPIPEGAKSAIAQIAASTLGVDTTETDSTPEIVEILDIPVVKKSRSKKSVVSADAAEEILENVLDALPEPKQPGTGRGRSRRASTPASSSSLEAEVKDS
jgi:ribonuclease E